MKRNRRLSILILALLLVTSMIAGCGSPVTTVTTPVASDSAATTSTVEGRTSAELAPANIVMYLVGDPQNDADRVYAEVNKKLQADINTTIEPKYMSWADYSTRYSLVFASGEEFDMIYTADWCFYAENATKNAFREVLESDVQTYAPDYYAQIPTDFWGQLRINGKVYMMPYLNKQVVGHKLIMTRGDLREKYNLPEIKTVADLDAYMLAIAANETDIKAYAGDPAGLQEIFNNIYYKQPANKMFINNSNYLTVGLDDPSGTVGLVYDDPAYIEILKHAKSLADAGAWSKSVLTNKIIAEEMVKAGAGAMRANHTESAFQFVNDTMTTNPEWKPEVADLFPDKIHQASSATRSGMGFNANGKNYERALMVMNLFGTDKDYYDLTTYGIEGVHFQAEGDNKIVSLEEGALNYAAKANCPWGWENKAFMRFPVNIPDSLTSLETNWIESGKASTTPLVSFNFVDTNVKNEIAACNNVFSIRGIVLICGAASDVEGEVAKLKEEMKQAGIDKIIAEYQSQVTAFLASTK